jgi:carboxypeptidase family protein
VIISAPLHAQNWNAHLEGLVSDPSGAPISAASARLQNTATGQLRQTFTNERGLYSFPLLPVGTYELELRKTGFATKTLRGLRLEIGRTARLDVRLELAREQAVVRVEAQPPLVETASPAIGDEIDNRRISFLPLNGRQFSQLALLAAGAVPPYPNGASQQFNTAAQGLGFSVNGQRSERNNFSLDGVTLMEPFAYSLTVNPSVDAVREFRVLENSYSTEQGLTSGAQVNIASRSGSNRFSGTAYEFLRNSAFDAMNFFDDPHRPIPPFRQNQFGASQGGPLRRDRTFFFANYEGFRVRQSVTNTTLLPPEALRQGDFTGLNPLTGRPFPPILDPATGQPFTGNRIPSTEVDPLSHAILARLPLPNLPNAPAGQNNNIDVGPHNLASDQFTLRLDHQINARHQIFGRFLLFNSDQLFPFVPNTFAQNPSAPPGFGTNKDDTGRNVALGLTSVFRPTLINDFRFGYVHYFGTKEAQNIHSNFLEGVGISRAPGATNRGIPAINVPGYADMGDSDIFQPQIRKDNTFQFTDNLAWVRGRHTYKFGGDIRRLRLFYLVEDFGQGIFSFSGDPVTGAGSVSGNAFADFLLGRPFLSFAQAGNSGGNDRLNYAGLYFADEFHATRRLTLTYGLREEFYSPPTNADGRASILDPSDATRFIVRNDRGQAQGLISDPLVQRLQQSYGLQFITSQQAGLPASLIRPDWAGWAPRLGFAYDLTGNGKTALRGGVGVFNSLGELDYAAETRLSAPITEFLFGLDLCRFFGPGACGQPFAPPPLSYGLAYQLGNAPPVAISSPPFIRNGYAYEWSLSLERELTPNTVLSLSYAGSDAHKLPRRALQNQGVPNLPDQRRGYHPQPGSNQFVRATDVNSHYHALIARLERRFSGGVSFVAGYTFGKSIDTASGLQGTNQPQDNYNLKAERGLSDFDVRQRFVVSSTWELPFGSGRRWAKDGPAETVLGQWQLASILTLQTGQPMTAILPTALSGTQSNGTDRPDLLADPTLPSDQRSPDHWFNTLVFQPPPIYFDARGPFSIPGNEGRNVIAGPGLADWDLTLERHARLTERANLVLRGDFFNLTNHPNFDRPGLILGTSNFGKISAAENSRQIQLSLRLNW